MSPSSEAATPRRPPSSPLKKKPKRYEDYQVNSVARKRSGTGAQSPEQQTRAPRAAASRKAIKGKRAPPTQRANLKKEKRTPAAPATSQRITPRKNVRCLRPRPQQKKEQQVTAAAQPANGKKLRALPSNSHSKDNQVLKELRAMKTGLATRIGEIVSTKMTELVAELRPAVQQNTTNIARLDSRLAHLERIMKTPQVKRRR